MLNFAIQYWYVPLGLFTVAVIGGIVLAIFEARKSSANLQSKKVEKANIDKPSEREDMTEIEINNSPIANTSIVKKEDDKEEEPARTTNVPVTELKTAPTDKEEAATRVQLKLGRKRSLSKEFERTIEKTLEKLQPLYRKILPTVAFHNGRVTWAYPEVENLPIMEKLLAFWKDDYRDPRMVPLLIPWLHRKSIANNKNDLQVLMRTMLTMASLEEENSLFLRTLFLDEKLIDASKMASPYGPETSIHQSMELVTHARGELTRKIMFSKQKWFEEHAPFISFMSFFGEVLYQNGNLFVRTYLAQRIPAIGSRFAREQWSVFIRSGNPGHISGILRNDEFAALLNQNASPAQLMELFSDSPLPAVNAFLILKRQQPEQLSTLVHDPAFRGLDELDPRTIASLPVQYKAGLFKLFSERGQWTPLMELYRSLPPVWQSNTSIRFYRARALFNRELYQEAWSEIFDIWKGDPENLVFLNEAAIYALKAGKEETSDEIFATIRRLYPDHAESLYNEALYYEERAKKEIAERWQEYHRVAGERQLTG